MSCKWNLGKVAKLPVPQVDVCEGDEQYFEVDQGYEVFRTRLCWKHAFLWARVKGWTLNPLYLIDEEIVSPLQPTPAGGVLVKPRGR